MITNDDGIASPGLRAAAEAVAPIADVVIIAPSGQRSASGRALLFRHEDALRRVPYDIAGAAIPAYAADCSPAMIVQHGLQAVFGRERPDLVLSGINYGENLGFNVTVSGTIGAALEAASSGLPALAVSLQTDPAFHYRHGHVDWETARHFTRYFAQRMLCWDRPADCHVLNVNVPDDATADTPWKVTRLDPRSYFEARLSDPHPEARLGDIRFGVFLDVGHLAPGTDIHTMLVERAVSVTPLTLDLTARVPAADIETLLRSAD